MGRLSDLIVEREAFDTGEGKSGAKLERVKLDDERGFLLKHESGGDLLSQAVAGAPRFTG